MVSIKLEDFGGEIPSRSPRLLPPTNAATCENVWLSESGLDTYSLPRVLSSLLTTTRYVYRIPTSSDITDYNASYWKQFVDPDTRMIKAPIANDSFERFYWAVPGTAPQYNTKARIINGDADYVLGLPIPANNLTVTPNGAGVGSAEVRAYVFTYVTAFGEEGPPSTPIIATGKIDDTWNLTLPAVGADNNQRNITLRRVYRTVTGVVGDTNFYLVVELPIATASYGDVISGTTVVAQGLLESTTWVSPPTTLEGLINMPNGIVAGFTGRDIYFSEPYRPHAWPVAYSVSVEHPVVGLGVVGTTLVVLTEGFPVAISGIHPDSMSQSKHPNLAPCVSTGSIVSGPQGVLYAGPDGLMIAAQGTVQLLTEEIISKRRWADEYDPKNMRAVWYKQAYLAMPYAGDADGFIIHITNPKKAVAKIPMPSALADNIVLDAWTGEPMFIMNSSLYLWDSVDTDARMVYRWVSKEFHHPKPTNYAALKIYFDAIPENSQSSNVDPWALTSLALLPVDVTGQLKLYADRVLVWTRNFASVTAELMRLPSGYKAEIFQLEIVARVRVDSVQLATNVKDLQTV